MSCILVALSSMRSRDQPLSIRFLSLCFLRDVAIISLHSTTLALWSNISCSSSGNFVAWLVADLTFSILRIIRVVVVGVVEWVRCADHDPAVGYSLMAFVYLRHRRGV